MFGVQQSRDKPKTKFRPWMSEYQRQYIWMQQIQYERNNALLAQAKPPATAAPAPVVQAPPKKTEAWGEKALADTKPVEPKPAPEPATQAPVKLDDLKEAVAQPLSIPPKPEERPVPRKPLSLQEALARTTGEAPVPSHYYVTGDPDIKVRQPTRLTTLNKRTIPPTPWDLRKRMVAESDALMKQYTDARKLLQRSQAGYLSEYHRQFVNWTDLGSVPPAESNAAQGVSRW